MAKNRKSQSTPSFKSSGVVVAQQSTGTVYSVSKAEIVFMENDKPSDRYPLVDDGGTEVFINDVKTFLDDLKRGDEVVVSGMPVTKIEAIRG